jgi:hypothetical protein
MTSLDVVFRYGRPPGPQELRAVDSLREVYGIRTVKFNEKESTVRVEFDASRMNEDTVAGLLRRAGVDLKDKLQLT